MRRQQIGQILLDLGYITREQLVDAVMVQKNTGKRIGDILLQLGYLNGEQLAEALAIQAGVEFVPVRIEQIQPEALALLDPTVARGLQALPLWIRDGKLYIALADIHDTSAQRELARLVNMPIVVVSASADAVQAGIRFYYPRDEADWQSAAQEPCVHAFLQRLFEMAGGDVRPVQMEPHDALYYRVCRRADGTMELIETVSHPFALISIYALKRMAGTQDNNAPYVFATIRFARPAEEMSVRVSCIRTVQGERVVLQTASRQNLHIQNYEVVLTSEGDRLLQEWIHARQGLILVSSNSWQSRSQFILQTIASYAGEGYSTLVLTRSPLQAPDHVFVVPLEYESPGRAFQQVVVTLEQEPDVLVLDTPPDWEHLQLLASPDNAHTLILLSMHAESPADALAQVASQQVAPVLFAGVLRGVVHLYNLPRLCGHCRTALPAKGEAAERLGVSSETVYDGAGCAECRFTGHAGVAVVAQVVQAQQPLLEALRHGRISEAVQVLRQSGEVVLREALRQAVMQGAISVEYAVETLSASQGSDLRSYLRAA
ncbi:MAG: hypothetical protein HPY54_16275 [Chthonomonadetes bacterium]|nr:hypothetical protein [Chthonomonadetes bacterium]